MTVVEILAYYAEEDWGILSAGMAAAVIAILSAAKFITVVMYYMHLKFDQQDLHGDLHLPRRARDPGDRRDVHRAAGAAAGRGGAGKLGGRGMGNGEWGMGNDVTDP
jgi:hypothetical protein